MGSDDGSTGEGTDEPAVDSERRRRLGQFEQVIQRLPDPVFVTDPSGYLSFANRAFVDELGYAVEDEVHVSEFIADEGVDTILELLREMVTREDGDLETRTVEFEGITAGGRTLVLRGSITLLPGDSRFGGVAAVLRDVTAEKRRNEVVAVMDRTLRHNLRNTVTVISTATEVLEDQVDDEYRELLDRIYDSAMWLQNLGERLRTLRSAIDESFERDETMSVERIVETGIADARTGEREADVTTHFAAQGELAAPGPVKYGIENIVENAIVYNDTEVPEVDVWVTHASRDGWVDIHVEDDGPGIPEFERKIVLGEATVDQLQHGSGMGLWIARWVVEVFGGELDIEDNDPRGSVVTLTLPLASGGGELR